MEKGRKKIIIVDDLDIYLLSIQERLKGHYEIFPAKSADILFEVLENIAPDLILMDINMPGSDGFDTIKQLKADSRYEDIPVIFLTSQTDKSSIMKGMRLGVSDYITKPFQNAKLIECIEYQLDPQAQTLNKPIILAVDDTPSVLQSVNRVLSSQYQVRTLSEPEKMKEILNMIAPDLFLLDCLMPKVSGFELVPIIRSFPIHEDTPIVFLSSEGIADNVYAARNIGADDFIIKPIDNKILREKMAFHLKDYIMRRRIRKFIEISS